MHLQVVIKMLDENYKEKVIRHELGHWFIAHQLGFKPGDISIQISIANNGQYYHQASSHIDLNPSLCSLEDTSDYIFKRASVLYAGTAFQCAIDERDSIEVLESDGSDDNSKLTELAFVWRGIKYPNDTCQSKELEQRWELADKCWEKVCELHNANEALIDKVVKEFMNLILTPNKHYVIKRDDIVKLFCF
ncbi:TPA: hypothetical protein ACX6SG_000718 [Photobacterium damselae]